MPRAQNQINHVLHAGSFLNAREDRRSVPPHELGIPVHDGERRRYQRGDIDLRPDGKNPRVIKKRAVTHFVDYEEVGVCDTRSSLPRDFISTLWKHTESIKFPTVVTQTGKGGITATSIT